MRMFFTRELEEAVAPNNLADALASLKSQGMVLQYDIQEDITFIEVALNVEIGFLLQEECTPAENPRPYVHNRRTDK